VCGGGNAGISPPHHTHPYLKTQQNDPQNLLDQLFPKGYNILMSYEMGLLKKKSFGTKNSVF
jgi:hypothetical protein